MFESSFMKYKERTALITETGKGITYRELDQLQKDMSHLICVEGLTLLVCTNTLESIVIYLASLYAMALIVKSRRFRSSSRLGVKITSFGCLPSSYFPSIRYVVTSYPS